MKPTFHFFILLLTLAASTGTHAQIISTDYNNCLHGVRDSSGNWIIDPVYEHVERSYNGYRVSQNGKWGVINRKGAVMVPLQYEHVFDMGYYYVNSASTGYFKVMQNGLFGAVDSTGHQVIKPEYYDVDLTADTIFIAEAGNDTYYFFNTKGERFVCPWKTRTAPYRVLPHCYAVRQKKKIIGKRYVGMVNDSGRIILPQEYGYISGYEQTGYACVMKKKRYGYCNNAGKFTWNMTLTVQDRQYYLYYRGVEQLGRLGRGPASVGKKYGMVSLSGDTLLPFIYDDIQSFENYPNRRATGNLWIITKDGKQGIYDDVNGWRIPVSCDSIATLETFFADGDSAQVGLILYRQHAKWGVTTTAGQEIFPCEYDEVLDKYSNSYVLRKGDSLQVLQLISRTHMEQLHYVSRGGSTYSSYYDNSAYRKEIPGTKTFSVFAGKENCKVYYHPGATHDSIELYMRKHLHTTGEYYDFVAPDSIITAACFYTQPLVHPVLSNAQLKIYRCSHLFREDAIEHTAPQVVYIPSNRKQKISLIGTYLSLFTENFWITTGEDVISKTGRLIASGDTLYSVYSSVHGSDGAIYFVCHNSEDEATAMDTNGRMIGPYYKGNLGDFSSRYAWWEIGGRSSWRWELFDTQSHKRVMSGKDFSDHDAPIWDSITIVSNESTGARLYNIPRKKYLSSYGFSYILPLSMKGDLFLMKTCMGKMGVMRADGTWLCDTVYTAMTPMGVATIIGFGWDEEIESSTSYYPHYILSNRTSRVLIDVDRRTVTSTAQAWPLIWKSFTYLCRNDFGTTTWSLFGHEVLEYPDDYRQPYFLIPQNCDTSIFRSWHKQCLVDSLFGSMRYTVEEYFEDTTNEFELYDLDYEHRPSPYCVKCGKRYQPYMWTRESCHGRFGASYVDDSVISFSYISWSYANQKPNRFNCSNVLLFPDGPRSMTLDSLFTPESDWRNFVINTVLNYLNTHKNVHGDCHNPIGLPFLMQQTWQVSDEGIVLYPPGFREENEQLQLLLPWNTLLPYLRKDVASKLPVDHHKP